MNTSVVIAGGGPVGLMTALLLDRFGIDCVIIERSPGIGQLPRARGYNQRTMEILRQVGLDDEVRPVPPRTEEMVFVDSVVGREIGRTRPEPDRGQSPTWKVMTPQDRVEEAIYGKVERAAHVCVRFSTEVVSVSQDDEGVTAEVRSVDTGEPATIRGSWLVAADGARSIVREQLGIELEGTATLAYGFSQRWRCDLSRLPAHAQPAVANRFGAFFVVSEDPVLPPTSPVVNDYGDDRWLSLFTAVDAQGRGDVAFSAAEIVDRIRRQMGIPDLDVELMASSTYRISDLVAVRYREGRVLLAGDAAHQFPPTGIGLNTGVQDAHNLAWKLAFVVKGLASDRLLDTYDAERRPIAQANAAWSTANARRLAAVAGHRNAVPPIVEAIRSGDHDRIAFAIREMEHHTHWSGQALGFNYEEGALLPDGSMPEAFSSRFYVPTDRPGARFPHLWVDLSHRISTLDWFDTDLALVAGPAGDEWISAGARVADKLGLTLGLQTLPAADPELGFHLGARGAVIVRPDGHVAWRMPGGSPDPAQELADALTFLLR